MKLFEPKSIGNVEIKNRFVMSPMISNLCNVDGNTNENHIAYLEDRAKGNFGLIITEYTYVDEFNGKGSPNEMGIFSYDQEPKFSRLTERVHKHGSKIFIQLVHAGGKANENYNRKEPFAPSSVDYLGYKPNKMTLGDINDVEERFYRAADIAYKSGFDGIELHGAHGYLLDEFISPALNKRSDKYGGNFENRMRIINEISENIKKYYDFPVGIRLSLYEDDSDGYDANYGLKVGESLKYVDYLHYSAGRFAPPGSSASFYYNHDHILDKLPRKPDKTTILVGSIVNLRDAEKALEKTDFIALGRAALADPYFPYKIQNGIEIRPCIRCNQACRNLSRSEVRCTVNVDTGLELYKNYNKYSGEIIIDGAGIKGLEAALYSLKLGFKPVVYEENDTGGQLNEIRDEYKRREFNTLIDYYKNILKKNNIEVNRSRDNSGINCSPDIIYPDIYGNGDISIDTNIYRYFDDVLEIAKRNNVVMSSKSLLSIERSRRDVYKKLAENAGVKFKDADKYDFVIYDNDQYDIRKAMISGRNAVDNHIMKNLTDIF